MFLNFANNPRIEIARTFRKNRILATTTPERQLAKRKKE